jgi:hypothetical protein
MKFFDVETFQDAVAAFRRAQENDRDEYGHHESLDSLVHASEPVRRSETFASLDAAFEWLQDNTPRWESYAVRVEEKTIPKDFPREKLEELKQKIAAASKKEASARDNAKERFDVAAAEVRAATEAADAAGSAILKEKLDALGDEGGAAFVTCRACKSKINASFRRRDVGAGESPKYYPRDCVVCGEHHPYVKGGVLAKVKKAERLFEEAKAKLKAAEAAYATRQIEERAKLVEKFGKKRTGWAIGADVHA